MGEFKGRALVLTFEYFDFAFQQVFSHNLTIILDKYRYNPTYCPLMVNKYFDLIQMFETTYLESRTRTYQ